MELIARFTDGTERELKDVRGVSSDCDVLVMKSTTLLRPSDNEKLEKELTKKIGKTVVVLPSYISNVLSV